MPESVPTTGVSTAAAALSVSFAELLEQRSEEWSAKIEAVADGRDDVKLQLVAEHLRLLDVHMERMRDCRDDLARKMREDGVPMTRIAKLARVSDSYLARRVFHRGGTRKFIRHGAAVISAVLLGSTVGWLTVDRAAANSAEHAVVAFMSDAPEHDADCP